MNRRAILCIAVGVTALALGSATNGMTLNLARPYDPSYSPPRSSLLAFPGARTAVFSKPGEAIVEVWCPSTRFTRGSWEIHLNLGQESVVPGSLEQSNDTSLFAVLPSALRQ